MSVPVVSFLSDYGLRDGFVGVCHGVIARGCPEARVIDLTHEVPPQDVHSGALVLASSIDYLPGGTVHLAVVDPEVGTARRAVAVLSRSGSRFVGPDNGLLEPAVAVCRRCGRGGRYRSVAVRTAGVSATFHGRDLFAPVAAALAAGRGAIGGRGGGRALVARRRCRARMRLAMSERSSRTSSTSTSSATSSSTRTRTTSAGSLARVRSRSARAPGTVRRSRSGTG